jgi:hypothetical protein
MSNPNTPERDWSEIGIAWERIPVGKEMGPHRTDLVGIGHVWAPRTIGTKEGIDALVAHFGPARVASWHNGSSSFDVKARSWFKARHTKNRDLVRISDEAMRAAVYQSVLMSAGRSRIVERETKLAIGPYTRIIRGGEAVEYATLFSDALAALLNVMPDAPPAVLRDFVAKSLESAGFTPDDEAAEEE